MKSITSVLQEQKIVSLDSRPQTLSISQSSLSLTPDEKGFFGHAAPEMYRHASIDSLALPLVGLTDFARSWAQQTPFSSIFMTGTYGSGKTYFAFALIREAFRVMRKKGYFWPKYYSSTALDAKLRKASMHEDGDEYTLREIGEEDLLFIDDLGKETRSDRLKRQYFEIINYRYSKKLPTIVTSNYTLDQLSEIIDGSISSRMQEWMFLKFPNIDMRKA